MGRRAGLLLVAILVAAAGTSLVFLYAHNANARALANVQSTKVLTVRATIPVGTTVAAAQSAGDFEVSTLPKDAVAAGALADLAPISGDVALTELVPGQQVVAAAFGPSTSQLSLPLPPGDVAVSVQLTDPTRVAGFLEPGSHVAVFLDIASSDAATTVGGKSSNIVRLLLPNTAVLAVGPTTITSSTTSDASGQTNTEQISKAIVTLAVDQNSAEKLIYGAEQGTLYFALVGPKSRVAPDAGVSATNLFS